MKNENQDLQTLQELTKKYTNPGVFANHVYKNIDIYKDVLQSIYPYLFVDYLTERESIKLCCTYFWRKLESPQLCPICGKLIKIKSGWVSKTCGNEICTDELRKATNRERYGCDSIFQNKDIRQKIKATNRERYGCDNAFQNKDIQQKQILTVRERYGYDNVCQHPDVKQKKKATNREKYGCDYGLQNKEVRQKIKETVREKYGCDYVSQNESIKQKIKATSLERYGVHCNLLLDSVKQKIKETVREKYGCDYAAQSPIIKQKIKATSLEKFGVHCNLLLDRVKINCVKGRKRAYFPKKLEFINKIENTGLYEIISGRQDPFEPIILKCNKCGNIINYSDKNENGFFFQRWVANIKLCTKCIPKNSTKSNESKGEEELFEFIRSIIKEDVEIIRRDRQILKPKELDIYLPNFKLAFEYNGIYWHSDKCVEIDYHTNKKIICAQKGVNLINIWEDDWLNKQDIIKSEIKKLFNLSDIKISSNDCNIKQISSRTANKFLNENHLEKYVKSQYNLGLFYKNKIIFVICFDVANNEIQINNFSNKNNVDVIDGFNKLIYYINMNYDGNINYYADLDWLNIENNIFTQHNFKPIETKQSYFWCSLNGRIYETELLINKQTKAKFMKIYNAGKLKYQLAEKVGQKNAREDKTD